MRSKELLSITGPKFWISNRTCPGRYCTHLNPQINIDSNLFHQYCRTNEERSVQTTHMVDSILVLGEAKNYGTWLRLWIVNQVYYPQYLKFLLQPPISPILLVLSAIFVLIPWTILQQWINEFYIYLHEFLFLHLLLLVLPFSTMSDGQTMLMKKMLNLRFQTISWLEIHAWLPMLVVSHISFLPKPRSSSH